jgi:hypothetical protein
MTSHTGDRVAIGFSVGDLGQAGRTVSVDVLFGKVAVLVGQFVFDGPSDPA